MEKAKLSFLDKPAVHHPINAMSGLYMEVLASEPCPAAELLDFVRPEVVKHGYNPDGRAMLGYPCQHGILSRSYAVWFYEKRKP